MSEPLPIIPLNGRVLVEELPFKPSTIIECFSIDRADITEGIVVALGPHRFGRRRTGKGEWEHTGDTFPHQVSVGDRIIFPPKYLDDDIIIANRKRYRAIDSWDVVAIIEKPQPEGFENAITGEKTPDHHPLLIH